MRALRPEEGRTRVCVEGLSCLLRHSSGACPSRGMRPRSADMMVMTLPDGSDGERVRAFIEEKINAFAGATTAAMAESVARVDEAMPLQYTISPLVDPQYTAEERAEARWALYTIHQMRLARAKVAVAHFEFELEKARALYAEAAGMPYYPTRAIIAREMRQRKAAGIGRQQTLSPRELTSHVASLGKDVANLELAVAVYRANLLSVRELDPLFGDASDSEKPRSRRAPAVLAPVALAAAGAALAVVALRRFAAGRVGRLLAAQGAEASPLTGSCVGARVVLLPDAPRHAGLHARRGQLGTAVAVNAAAGTLDVRWDRGGAVTRAVPAAALLRVARKRALEPQDRAAGVRVCLRAGAGGMEAATRHGTLVGAPPLVALPLKLIGNLALLLGPLGAALRGGRDDDVARVRWDGPRAAVERIRCRELAWCGFELCAQQHAPDIAPPELDADA